MSIRVVCKHCNAKLNVAEKHQGKKTKCPKCQKPITIPTLQTDDDDGEFGFLAEPGADQDANRSSSSQKKQKAKQDDAQSEGYEDDWADEFDESEYGGVDDDYGDDYDEYQSAPPKVSRKKKKPKLAPKDRPQKPKRRPEDYAQEEDGGMFNAGLMPGILMMAGAVIWFVVGLQAGFIYFSPPILFIAGLISFFRGLMD